VWIQVDVFWVVTPCSVVVGHQCFGRTCCLHLQVTTPYSVLVGYQRFGGLCWRWRRHNPQELNLNTETRCPTC